MESFNDILTKWQPFFSTVATVAATLAGLLFVSLSINRETITAPQNRLLLRLAHRSFGDLIFALFIAILFLVPAHETFSLAIPLFSLAAFRGWFLLRSISRSAQGAPNNAAGLGAMREHAFQSLSFLGLVAASFAIYRGTIAAAFFLVPVIALLLCNATLNAWLLLIMEKNAVETVGKK